MNNRIVFSLAILAVVVPRSAHSDETTTNSIDMEFALIPAGTFTMGSPDGEAERDDKEKQHQVTITKPFYIGVHEVTQAEYGQVMNGLEDFRDRSAFAAPENPVENVEWQLAKRFCERLTGRPEEETANRKYRLPTEAEWEHACRAGTNGLYGVGQSAALLKQYGRSISDASGRIYPTASLLPNDAGLFDLHGNVWEWTQNSIGSLTSVGADDRCAVRGGRRAT